MSAASTRVVVSLLLAAHLGPGEAAKGSLRAGVLSRGGMRRSKSRHYDHGLGWDAHDPYMPYRRRGNGAMECNEVCQYKHLTRRLLGLATGETATDPAAKKVE